MIRLHVWTIVTDLCISAEADRPAPAVVHRPPRLHQVAAYSLQCEIRGSFWAVRKLKTLFCDGHHRTNAVRPMHRSRQAQLVQLWNSAYWVRVLITRRHELGFVTTRCALHIVTEK